MTVPEFASDAHWMRLALNEAYAARAADEVPVGAVVVCRGVVVATGKNAPIATHDPTAHAEIVALRAAAQQLENYRLEDCELFVTLEPCVMCAGAMLHARLKRVVFGAADPKTGAAGSVLNVFATGQLNHQTQVNGGVLAQECSHLLQDFFKSQREQQQRARAQAGRVLRDDALRTPQHRFDSLPELPIPSRYLSDLPSLSGLRMHYLDAALTETMHTYFCVHSPEQWSYAWGAAAQAWQTQGIRVICPDLIGFGQSDKPKKESVHGLRWHVQVLLEFINHLSLHKVTLILPDNRQSLVTHRLIELMVCEAPDNFTRVMPFQLDDMSPAAALAPFPDAGHRAAQRAFSAIECQLASAASKKPTP